MVMKFERGGRKWDHWETVEITTFTLVQGGISSLGLDEERK
jgi:hypothetical protein